MPHLSELHGAATHLAVVAVPLYALVLLLRRFWHSGEHETLAQVEPWLLGASVAGVAAAGATGLLVWGQAQRQMRGQAFRVGTAHFWLGILLAIVLVAVAVTRYLTLPQGPLGERTFRGPVLVAAVLALGLVVAQGYLGGRMTYEHGVGVQDGGQFAGTATGVEAMAILRAKGATEVQVGRLAFSAQGLGCARCHGEAAQGRRGPTLAGRQDVLDDVRRVHGHGLFPVKVVSDQDVNAIAAWLRAQPRPAGARGGDDG